jgi:hypothetical protein
VRPPLGDLLVLLDPPARDELRSRLDELTAGISSGRFSLAWQYPALVAFGREEYEKQQRVQAVAASARRGLEAARRRLSESIRGAGVAAEAGARLQRALRDAESEDAVAAVESELNQLTVASRSAQDRRREREIERTRSRIRRAAPHTDAGEPSESWQDVLRRFSEQQGGAGL